MRVWLVLFFVLAAAPAFAQRIDNPTAEFAGLDKITARITKFDVKINETVQFGALQVTPRVCYSSAANDDPLTTGFIEVDEITLENKIHRIFSGWMFADSPGLNAVEHPVYDIWLVSCKGGVQPKPADDAAQTEEQPKAKGKKAAKPAPQPTPEPDDDLFVPPPQAPRQLQPGAPDADPNAAVRQRHERRAPTLEPEDIEPGVPFDPDDMPED
jgi:hypothetical protein